MDFDINTLRSVVTLVSLLLFVGLMVWTWNRRRKEGFDEAAQLPFLTDDLPASSGATESK
jgi:cytochrome c oxidase cbb3-type subunit 4